MKKSEKMQKEPRATVKDVLLAVNNFADEVKKDMSELKQDIKDVKSRLGTVEDRLDGVESTINTQVVKKTDLEEAFATFEYKKVNKLTSLLQQKKILNQSEAQAVLSV